MKKSPAKSTASDRLRNRNSGFFETVYFSLVKHYQSFLRTAVRSGEKAFSVVATLVRIHLISLPHVYQLKSGNRHYNTQYEPSNTGKWRCFEPNQERSFLRNQLKRHF